MRVIAGAITLLGAAITCSATVLGCAHGNRDQLEGPGLLGTLVTLLLCVAGLAALIIGVTGDRPNQPPSQP
jgi:hypothetical protein